MDWRKKDLLRDIERIALGIAITRPDGTIRYANRRLCEMLGIGVSEPVDLPLARFITVMKIGADEEMRAQRRGGEMLDFLYAVYPLCDDDGAITHHAHLLQPAGEVTPA